MKNIKLLVVDDEKEFTAAVSERLSMRNLNPKVASSGEEALSMIDNEVPDVVILDLKMPGMDGMDVLRKIKDKYPGIRVIILTGHGDKQKEEQAQNLGAFDFLHKPANIDHLTNRIKEAYDEIMKEFENSMTAATFAEEGEWGMAKEEMKK